MKYFDDNFYHVYNRGAHQALICFSEENYEYCLRLVTKYAARYHISIIAYCMMPNHYHFLLQQEAGGSVSRFLQTTFNAYTQAVNKQRDMHGTLFESRGKGVLVDSDRHLLHLIRYIHLNPVEAGLVNRPEKWKYSDYMDWISHNETNPAAEELRKSFFQNGQEYKRFVEEFQRDKETQIISRFLFD